MQDKVIQEILNVPDDIPQDLLDKARCVVVMPSVLKAAFVGWRQHPRCNGNEEITPARFPIRIGHLHWDTNRKLVIPHGVFYGDRADSWSDRRHLSRRIHCRNFGVGG
jgi:hypothetical protein